MRVVVKKSATLSKGGRHNLEAMTMTNEKLKQIEAEIQRQDEELAAFEAAMRQLDTIELPTTFIADFDEASERRSAVVTAVSQFPVGIRA
jgi:hypothetical protein